MEWKKTQIYEPKPLSSYVGFSVPIRVHVPNPFRGKLEEIQAVPCKHKLLMIISSFSITWNIFLLCSERALQSHEVHPACLFYDHLSELLCSPGGFPNFEAASACLIIFPRHLKFYSRFIWKLGSIRGIERLAMLVGDPCSGPGLFSFPMGLRHTVQQRMPSLGVSPPLAPCVKLQRPLIGVNFTSPRKNRRPISKSRE